MMYDLIVIGGGPAGYLGAERAAQAGLKVALIEKNAIGGVCLNEGCVPTKTLLYSAKILDNANHGEKYGVKVTGAAIDHAAVMKRKDKVVKTLVSGVSATLKKLGVTVYSAQAFIQNRISGGFEVKAGEEVLTTSRLLIATGSMPIIIPVPGVKECYESGYILTNREALSLSELPQSICVIGGGVIGLELASYFNSCGCKVTVVEMLDRIGGTIDKKLAEILLKNYQKKGIEFHLGAKVTGVAPGGVSFEKDGGVTVVKAEKALLSTGRRPVTKDLGLENIGVELERGAIKTDEGGRTSCLNVFAAGDVNGKYMLAHVAYREAEVCINTMTGKKDSIRYSAVPSVIYTNPEVGCVGLNEETAKAEGMDVEIREASMMYSGRYVAENEGGNGICKLVLEKGTNRIVGVHMISNYASEIIYGAALMIESQMCVDDVKELIFPHPTVGEAIREMLFE
ncbi:MAG: dihydrolipoyl dehydrogenase [Christensenellales bacterium]